VVTLKPSPSTNSILVRADEVIEYFCFCLRILLHLLPAAIGTFQTF